MDQTQTNLIIPWRSSAGKLGNVKSLEKRRASLKEKQEKYLLNPSICNKCKQTLPYKKRRNSFCSHSCVASRIRKPEIYIACALCNQEFKKMKKTQLCCSPLCASAYRAASSINRWLTGKTEAVSGKGLQIKSWVRRFLFEKYNNACQKCSWAEINPTTNKIPLEINHIDGNALNNQLSNLELLCPNCHSLTPNFRALNKNSKRKR